MRRISGLIRKRKRSEGDVIEEILERTRTIAVVGLSDKPSRPSYGVAQTLTENGYRIFGVNPHVQNVLGFICYSSLAAVPEVVDLVNVFRRAEAVNDLVDEVIALRIPFLWLQEGIVNEEAAERARRQGIKVVMNRCIAKELMRRL